MKRLSIISLDGVNWDTVQPTLDAGKLPFIQGLIKEGSSSVLQTHSFISSGATWPSIHTGTHPGEHGIFFSHRQLKSGTYEFVKKSEKDIPFKAFWQIASDEGIPTIAFDLPKAPYIKSLKGLVLNSWGEESPWYAPSYPRNLKKEIHKKFGRHPLQEFYHRPMKSTKAWLKLKQDHIDALNSRFKIAKYLMHKQEDWQLFIMSINELHLAGHLFWHTANEGHHNYDPELREAVGNVMEELLVITDRGLQELSESNPESCQLLLSNNGMGESKTPIAVMDILLKKLGYMHGAIPEADKVDRMSFNVIQTLEEKLPMKLVQTVKAAAPKKLWYKVTRKLIHSSKDYKKSQAFPMHNDVSGAIRINLKGREPSGIVSIEDYDSVCKEICEDLETLTINKTGIKAIKKIILVQQEYPGENMHELADILVIWNDDNYISSIEGESIGSISVKDLKRAGAHTEHGIFILDEQLSKTIDNEEEFFQDLNIYPSVLNYFDIHEPTKIKNQ